MPCIGWFQVFKYNSGVQQFCYGVKAQAHTHKVAQREWQVGGAQTVFSVCVLTGNTSPVLPLVGPGGMELQQPPLSHCWIQHGVFSSNKMQQKWQCSDDEREKPIILPKVISTSFNNGLFSLLDN